MTAPSIPSLPVWRARPLDAGRRRVIAGFAACAGGALLARDSGAQPAGQCVLTPDSGEGPFYFDPELVRSDIRDGAPGATLEIEVSVSRLRDCATLEEARVDLWHADAIGLYSGYDRQPGTGEPSRDVAGQTFLRGTQLTDAAGRVRFTTIYPSWYRGRTPHIHFKIFLGGDEVVASQLFFPEAFNTEVFERFEPYRSRRDRRETFNDNDSFLTGSVDGAFCEVDRRGEGYHAEARVVVDA